MLSAATLLISGSREELATLFGTFLPLSESTGSQHAVDWTLANSPPDVSADRLIPSVRWGFDGGSALAGISWNEA